MKILREFVHEPKLFDKRHFSNLMLEKEPFKTCEITQGGYGILDNDFYVKRIANRGYHVFVFCLSGKAKLTMEDGSEFFLNKNEVFISTSTGQGHKEEAYGDTPLEMIWFTVLETSTRIQLSFLDYSVLPFEKGDLLKQYILELFKEDAYQDAKSFEAIGLYEQLFLITLERSLNWIEDIENKWKRIKLAKLWETVTTRIDEPWSIEDLCSESNTSKAHLHRICKTVFNCAPGEKVRELKMDRAKFLLRNTFTTISEIAIAVGYDNPATFSAAFNNYCKMSPREYRNQKNQH